MIFNNEVVYSMNIAVIGLGSMGKRRIRLIKELYPDFSIVGIDGREDRRSEAGSKFDISCSDRLSNVDYHIDCVFVCTSPLSHSEIIEEALRRKCHVFTELNLISDGYENNICLANENNVTLFLSSTFLYREEIQYICKKVRGKKWNYVYHIGQYLPDWHPWENYKEFFLGDKRTNGCREIMAIELPWLTSAFGCVEEISASFDKMSDLDIEYNDNYMVQLKHKSGSKGVLIVDVVSPVAVRNLEIYKENDYISWKGTPETLATYNMETKDLEFVTLEKAEHIEGYKAFVVENAYKSEIKEFFNVILKGNEPSYSFEQDKEVLGLIDSIGA